MKESKELQNVGILLEDKSKLTLYTAKVVYQNTLATAK